MSQSVSKTSRVSVSVVIPTYNRESLVLRAIHSALGQTHTDLEVIVVDDASKDRTASVVDAIPDPRLRLLRHPTNLGGAVARNTGLRAARGDFIALLDSDDEWLPEKLQVQIGALLASGDDFCYCQCYLPHPDGRREILPPRPFSGGGLLSYLTSVRAAMQSSACVVHRSVIVPFDESLSMHQDWDWVLQVARRTDRFRFVPQPLYCFHTDAPVRTANAQTALAIERAQPFLRKHAQAIQAEPVARRYLFWGYAQDALACGNRRLARSILWQQRLFPSLWRRPTAFRTWFNSLRG